MQRCDVTVRLGGDLGNTVRKTGVSPAEIVILREIHGGPDAVVEIQPTKMDKVPHADERARLVYLYSQPIVDRLFPGAFAALPVSLKDVQITDVPEGELEPDSSEEAAEPKAADEPEPVAPIADPLEPDDRAIVEAVMTAKNKAELHAIAEENEVDLSDVPEKMDDMRRAIVTGLFPNYQL
jgi:hypothetical protein